MNIDSPKELAHAVNDRLKLNLTARPWNMHAAGDTLWWLVPSTDWPAYQHGKLTFSSAKDDARKALLGIDDAVLETEKIFCGFSIEKGYGQEAVAVNPALRHKPTQLMNRSWLWWRVVEGNGPLQFANTLKSAATSGPLYLYVVCGYVHDRESTVRPERDAVMLRCDTQGLGMMQHSGRIMKRFPLGVLSGAEHSTDFSVLATQLASINGFYWVDLYVGTHVLKGDIDLLALHQRVLSHFDHWLVPVRRP